MVTKKLSRDEAEEFTRNLGQIAVGNYGMMEMAKNVLKVPEALGMDFDQWVQERLGGFVRMTIDQRRQAVAELSGEVSDKGRYAKTSREVAEILGISEETVKRDREVLAILETPKPGSSTSTKSLETPKPLTPAEKPAAIRKLLDEGKTNAEIAVELGIGVSTVGKERSAWKRDNAPQPSDALKEAKAEKAAVDAAKSPADKKATDAAIEDGMKATMTELAKAGRLNPIGDIRAAIKSMETIGKTDYQIPPDDFKAMVVELVKLNRLVWEHGAIQGFDVSEISKWIGHLE